MFDLLNISIVISFAILGFYRGFIKEFAGLLIFILAAVSAFHFAIPLDFIISKSIPFPLFSTILSHIIVFMTVLTATKLFFLKSLLQHIRFFSTGADGILGALFGGIKGIMSSLLIFSCLYVSGAGNALSLDKTWSYSLDHALYNKLALFVTNNEIMALGKIKHVEQNLLEDAVVLDEIKDEEKSGTNNLDHILSIMREGKILEDSDYESIADLASSLPVDKIDSIFVLCCQNIKEQLDKDKISAYIGSLILDNYKKDNILSDIQNDLSKKIDNILSEEEPKVIPENKPIINKKTDDKISNSDAAIPVPIKKDRNIKKIPAKQNIEMKKDEKIVATSKAEPIQKLNKPKKTPIPQRKPLITTSVPKQEIIQKKEIIERKEIISKKSEYIESDDLRNDINSLIEDSIDK